MLCELKEFDPQRISVLDLEHNQGKATAVQTGANYLADMDYIENIAFLMQIFLHP